VSQFIVLLALVFSIVIAIFAVQNTTPVPLRFLTYSADEVAVSVLVLISAALGAAAILLLGISREVTLRWRLRSQGQQLKMAQSRVSAMEAQAQTAAPAAPALEAGDTTAVPVQPAQADKPSSTPAP